MNCKPHALESKWDPPLLGNFLNPEGRHLKAIWKSGRAPMESLLGAAGRDTGRADGSWSDS